MQISAMSRNEIQRLTQASVTTLFVFDPGFRFQYIVKISSSTVAKRKKEKV
jgi:hypothetical protein